MNRRAPVLRRDRRLSRRTKTGLIIAGVSAVLVGLLALAVWWFIHVNTGAALTDLQPQAVADTLTNGQSLSVRTQNEKYTCRPDREALAGMQLSQWKELALPDATEAQGEMEVRFRSGSTDGTLTLLSEEQAAVIHIGRYYRIYQLPGQDYQQLKTALQKP